MARILLTVGALLGLGYAAWAFTARRGIFADFADGNAVSSDDARSSDTIDTVLLVVAAVIAVAALLVWVLRRLRGGTHGGGLEIGGLAAAALGAVLALVGVVIVNTVGDDGTQTELGEQAVTGTIVSGVGFTLLAVGLLLGLIALKDSRQAGDASFSGPAGPAGPAAPTSPNGPAGRPNW